MKYFSTLLFLIVVQLVYSQSNLSTSKGDCSFILPWTCDQCTFNWTGECIENLPTGEGLLTVFNGDTEIMRYEGEMKNGKFDGFGTYKDGMNELEGEFRDGAFTESNPFTNNRNRRIDTTNFNKTNDWETKEVVTKQIDNLYFTFPAKGYAYENRDMLANQCLKAIKENCTLINDPEFTEFTRIRFVESKDEMLLHADLYVNALTNIHTRSIHMIANDEREGGENSIPNPPIKHELMHIISMTAWGPPPPNCNWLNEGLATYSENNCSGYSVAEMYRYFMEKDMLIPIDSLSNHFFQADEMISYHQSAYIVEYMILNYGIEKLEALWKSGFQSFENIYGFTFDQMEKELNQKLLKQYPKSPKIDWSIVSTGCK